jgi:spermidine/putrescine transport system permease protein
MNISRFLTSGLLILLYFPFLFLFVSDSQIYLDLLRNESLHTTLFNSLKLALVSTFLCQPICLILIFLSSKSIERSLSFLMGVPEILMSLALLLVFMLFNFPFGFQSLVVAHVLLIMPFCFLILKLTWLQIPSEFVESAQDLGASTKEIFWRVQWPLLRPAFVASTLLGFLLSFDDFLLSFFLGGADFETLPVRILTSLKVGLSPELKALSTLLLFLSLTLILFVGPILLKILQKEVAIERK